MLCLRDPSVHCRCCNVNAPVQGLQMWLVGDYICVGVKWNSPPPPVLSQLQPRVYRQKLIKWYVWGFCLHQLSRAGPSRVPQRSLHMCLLCLRRKGEALNFIRLYPKHSMFVSVHVEAGSISVFLFSLPDLQPPPSFGCHGNLTRASGTSTRRRWNC